MAFVSVMLVPVVYYWCIPLWLCSKWLDRVQFWLGCLMYMFCGPFLNISVLIYACIYMDSFGWGKTRKVITEGETEDPSQQKIENHANASDEPQVLALEEEDVELGCGAIKKVRLGGAGVYHKGEVRRRVGPSRLSCICESFDLNACPCSFMDGLC